MPSELWRIMKQLPELWRRGIIIPLTSAKAKEMAQLFVSSESDAEYLPIQGDDFFYRIWKTNLFQDLNQRCNLLIDDFQEEALPPESLGDTLCVINEHKSRTSDLKLSDLLTSLEDLVRRAVKLEVPVYFVL